MLFRRSAHSQAVSTGRPTEVPREPHASDELVHSASTYSGGAPWRQALRREPVLWLIEFVFRATLRVLILRIPKGLRIWWWINRVWPASCRSFPSPPVGAVSLSVTLDNAVGRSLFYGTGLWRYEAKTSRALAAALRPGDVFLDGGASYGWFTALGVRLLSGAGSVIAVEASADRARTLEVDLDRAGIGSVTVLNAALAAGLGTASLRLPEGREEGQATLGAVSNEDDAAARTVELITLDSLGLTKLDIVKLDIEGAEFDALLGAAETISRCRPRLMLIEALETNLGRFDHTASELAALLDRLGYGHETLVAPPEASTMWVCNPKVRTRAAGM